MTEEKIYKPQWAGIIVVLVGLGIILLIDFLEGGFGNINWIGLIILSAMAILAFIRVWVYGSIVLGENTLGYWNWLFQKEVIKIEKIIEIDWRGVWFRALRIKVMGESGKFSEKRIATGSMTKKNIKELIKELRQKNQNIQLKKGIVKIIEK